MVADEKIRIPQRYRKPILYAVIFHVLLLCVLIFTLSPSSFRMPASGNTKTVHATTVSQAQLQQAVQQAQQPQLQKIAAEKAAQQLAQEKAAKQLAQEKAAEQAARLAQEKAAAAQAARLAQQKVAAQKALVLQQQKMAALKIAAEKAQAAAQAKKLAQEKAAKIAKLHALKLQQEKLAQKKLAAVLQSDAMNSIKKAANQEQQALAAKQKKLQEALMQQQLNNDAKSISSTVSQAQMGAIDKYKAAILSAIQANWHIDEINSKIKCIYTVQVAPDGTVLSIQLTSSSGDSALDASAKQAILLASPLPVPHDPTLFSHFRQLVLTLSPQGVMQTVGMA